jgi:hypothetical protein
MEFALRTKGATDAWTAVVPWARAWHRPAPVRRSLTMAAGISRTELPMEGAQYPPRQDAWVAALSTLCAAREQRADVGDLDSWPGVMAQHAVHLAVARVRLLATQLELTSGELAGGGMPR